MKPPPHRDNSKPRQDSPQKDTLGEDEVVDQDEDRGEELDKLQDPEDIEAPHLDAPQESPQFSNLKEDNAKPTELGNEEASQHRPTTDVGSVNTTESLLNTTANTTESDYYEEVWCV